MMWPEPYGRAETTAPSSANSRAIAMADDDAAAVASGRMAVVIECRLPVVRAAIPMLLVSVQAVKLATRNQNIGTTIVVLHT